ncbi:MAG: putative Ig domain-containing protein, partial [Verrucomicrobiales bacterium]|nr:putative Ig domain-containing protein [Verrucomicrobiales bacterium]
ETPVTFAGSGGGYETPSGIAIQKDGRILIGGNASNGSGSFGFGVARLRWDGSLDTAFGQAGVDVVDVGSLGSVSTALALQSDGRLLQAGIGARPSGKSATIILRRLTDAPAPAPTLRIVTPPTAQSVAQGATAVFSVVAQSTPDDLALSYQWYRNSTSLQGETGPTLSVIADLTTEGNYSVKVSNGYTEAYSGAKLTAIVPPVILTQPQSITIPVKANSGISVTTKGHTPQVCEWFRNGQFVSSSSSNTVEGWFGLNVGSPGTDGAYVAVITTPDGTVTSDVVVVTLAADPSVSFTTLDQLLPLGAPLSIASLGLTTGADTRREWFRDGKAIPQATNASTYSLQKCSFADAGNYKMSFSSSHGLVWTPELKVGVVDPSPQPERVVAEGGRVQISATVAGSGLVYRWQKNGTDLTDGGQLQGTASRVLTITSASSDDAGAYICQISTSQATPPLATGATQLRVTRQVPSLEGITLPDGAIAEPYSFDLDPPIPATRFSITGLPKGLRYDGSTGLISGIPQAYGDFKVRVIATNPSGTSDPVWMALHIAQGPFPASERFSGWIDWGVASSPDQSNHPSVTEMANRLEIRLTEAGTYTGSIEFCPLLGTRYRLPIKGQLVRDATGYVATQAIQIPRYPFASGKGQMVLTATGPTSPIGVRIDFGGLTPDLPLEQTVTGTAHPVTWDSRINPATEAAGTYNVIIDGSSQVQGEPGGAGFLRLIVRSDGAVITAGQLADGSTIVGSHVLLDSKHILLRQWLYGFRGSASALLEVEVGTPPAYWDSQISGAMHWRKPRLRRDAGSNYPWGFESTRSVGPATKYLPPNTPFYSGPLMMNTSAGLGNLTVTVGGDPYGAAEATLNGSHFARSGPNPSPGEDYDAITGLRFNPKTGLFSGRIVITQYELDYDHLDRDGNPKTVRSAVSRSFRGLVGRFPSSLYGKGFGFSFFNQRYTEADPVTGKERVLIYRLSVPVAIDQTY